MGIKKLIEKYNIDKQNVEKLEQIMHDKAQNISFQRWSFDGKTPKKQKGKCLEIHYIEIENYGEWPIYERYYTSEHPCSKFDNCKKESCIGYKDYTEYREAKQNYLKAKDELWNNHSVFIMIIAGLKNKFKLH